MGKYIHYFETESEFEEMYNGEGYKSPWLSFTEGMGLSYNKDIFNGYDYVDLGLPSGTLWATCNVGANSPEECGNYYAWGETVPKEDYSNETYIFGSAQPYTKYDTDGKTKLEFVDDAARVNMGGLWRLPTPAEAQEFTSYDNVTTTKVVINGINCIVFTSDINGNSITIPEGGFFKGTSTNNYNATYGLMLSDVNTSDHTRKYMMTGRHDVNTGMPSVNNLNPRVQGLNVRGVINLSEI